MNLLYFHINYPKESMKSKRSLSLLLAALMLVSPLASCSTANEGGTV